MRKRRRRKTTHFFLLFLCSLPARPVTSDRDRVDDDVGDEEAVRPAAPVRVGPAACSVVVAFFLCGSVVRKSQLRRSSRRRR